MPKIPAKWPGEPVRDGNRTPMPLTLGIMVGQMAWAARSGWKLAIDGYHLDDGTGQMAWAASSGWKPVSVGWEPSKAYWLTGLDSPFGMETQRSHQSWRRQHRGELARCARSGWKLFRHSGRACGYKG